MCAEDHLRSAKLLIANGANVNEHDIRDHQTAVHVAASIECEETLEFLYAQGADFNAQSRSGNTPLMMAAHNGNLKIVKLLIELGADVNVRNNKGKTAMNFAMTKWHEKITIYLLQNGAEPNGCVLDTHKLIRLKNTILTKIKEIETILFPEDDPNIAHIIFDFTFALKHISNYLDQHHYE